IDDFGLLSIAGGKWTTYRRMAEDCVNQAATLARLPEKAAITENLRIHGFHLEPKQFADLGVYGSDAFAIQRLIRDDPRLGEHLHPALSYCAAEVVWATRHEMARTVEDVLARRTRALFLNAQAASEMAGKTAEMMADELHYDDAWKADQVEKFCKLSMQ